MAPYVTASENGSSPVAQVRPLDMHFFILIAVYIQYDQGP